MLGRTLRLQLLLLAVLAMHAGCRGQAELTVRADVDREAEQLARNPAVIDDSVADPYLDDLGQLVLDAARRLEGIEPGELPSGRTLPVYDRFDVVLVHSDTVNAWVYGDDYTCVTTRLFLESDSPEEMVAVLCHEFGHLREAHLVESHERELAHHAVADAIHIAGAFGDLAAAMYGVPVQVSGLTAQLADDYRYSFRPHRPKDEFEADKYGLRLYASMGLDLAEFDDVFERSLAQCGDVDAPTHPRMSERLERVRAQERKLAARSPGPRQTLDEEPFHRAQARIRGALAARERANVLVTHEQEVRTRVYRGLAAPPRATACWPPAPFPDDGQH